MNKDNLHTEISFFKSLLIAELQANHPEKIDDLAFISQRCTEAETAFEDARREGKTAIEAESIAITIIFEGLHFSKINTIRNVLANEFSDKIDVEKVNAFALLLLPKFEELFDRYSIDDHFGEKPDFARLYTEITGAIHFYFVDYGI